MSFHETVWVLIVAAEHDFVRVSCNKWGECLKVFCSAAFAYQNIHPEFQFSQRFIKRKTFVVGANAGLNIFLCLQTGEAGRVTIDRLSMFMCGSNLFHYIRILM